MASTQGLFIFLIRLESWMMRGCWEAKIQIISPGKDEENHPKTKKTAVWKNSCLGSADIGLFRVSPAPAGTWENRTRSCQLHNDQWINFSVVVLRIFNNCNDCQQTAYSELNIERNKEINTQGTHQIRFIYIQSLYIHTEIEFKQKFTIL